MLFSGSVFVMIVTVIVAAFLIVIDCFCHGKSIMMMMMAMMMFLFCVYVQEDLSLVQNSKRVNVLKVLIWILHVYVAFGVLRLTFEVWKGLVRVVRWCSALDRKPNPNTPTARSKPLSLQPKPPVLQTVTSRLENTSSHLGLRRKP